MKKTLTIVTATLVSVFASAQYTTDKVVGDKKTELIDSLKKADYPYLFPIWGKKVVNKGFDIPKSAGFSAQYLWQESDIIINDLEVGFNNGPLYNLDEIVRFNNAVASSKGVNIRPDIWVLPFLNVYGILAKSQTSTTIDVGVWVPNDTSWNKVTDFNTKAEFDAVTYGFGLTPTVGIGGFFMALDMNFTWSDIEELDKPAYVFVLGPRFGKNIRLKRPQQSIAMWVGGFRVHINSQTTGSIGASSVLPLDEWEAKIETGNAKVESSQQQVDDWWTGLTPLEQKNPVNIAKYQTANAALTRAGNILNAASQIVADAGDGSIQYSLNKKQKKMWNFLIGSQFQLNKSWMIRAEYGFLGTRQQFIAGLQYRFSL